MTRFMKTAGVIALGCVLMLSTSLPAQDHGLPIQGQLALSQ